MQAIRSLYKRVGIQAIILTLLVLPFTSSCILSDQGYESAQPLSFLLTWQDDPATTMTIDWHMESDTKTYLEYRESETESWHLREGDLNLIPYSDRRLFRIELKNLKSDQLYEFRFSGGDPVYRFRTMPSTLTRPVHFIATGDMKGGWWWMEGTGRSAMQLMGDDLDFVVIGGDLAYADGRPARINRWFNYLRIWSEFMITEENRVIPHVAAIGNHEVRRGYIYRYSAARYLHPDFAQREAPFYTMFVAYPGGKGYGVLDFGDYLSLFLLDSGHLNFVDGEQADWLEREMFKRKGAVTHIIPSYHVTAWPSAREFGHYISAAILRNWVPVFEEYGVRLALEHHDHTYKRTHPLRNHTIDETGIYYVGDGAWGVRTRNIYTDEEGHWPWYLANADSNRHFTTVELLPDEILLNMYDEEGRHFDELRIVN